MTTVALALPFRTTFLLVLLILLLTRETQERIIGISYGWLWFAVVCNTVVMLIRFIHPTISLFEFAMLMVTGLYLYLVPVRRWCRAYPNIVGLGVLLLVVQWKLGREMSHIGLFHLSIEVWLPLLLTLGVILGLGRSDRLLSVNALFLITTLVQACLKWAVPDTVFGPPSHVLFSEYWLSVLFVTLVNLSEILLVTRRFGHP